LLLIYRPRRDERLSWPGWLTCSRWLTHICGHPSAAGRAQDRESRRQKTDALTTEPRHQSRVKSQQDAHHVSQANYQHQNADNNASSVHAMRTILLLTVRKQSIQFPGVPGTCAVWSDSTQLSSSASCHHGRCCCSMSSSL